MKKFIAFLMAIVMCVVPISAAAKTDGDYSCSELEAIMEIEPENMSYSQYFLFEHGFHTDESSSDVVPGTACAGDSLLSRGNTTIYAGDEAVSGYVGNSEMVFYMVGNTIYRYHVQSRQTDAIFQGSGIVTWYPITSKVLLIGKNNGITASEAAPPVCTDELDLEVLAYYEVDTEEQKIELANDPEWDILLTQGDGFINLNSYSCTINGKSIPSSEYPINSTYSSDGYDGSIECAGFAREMYVYLWSDEDYGQKYDNEDMTGSTWQSMKSYLNTKNPGARVRVSQSSAQAFPGHSFIICRSYTNYIIVYHANWSPGYNIVHVTHFTYEQLHSLFSYVHMVQNPW